MSKYQALSAHLKVELYIFEKIKTLEENAEENQIRLDLLLHFRTMIDNLLYFVRQVSLPLVICFFFFFF